MKIAENDRDMLEYLTEACESQVYVCYQCGHEEALATFDIASDLRDYMTAEQHQGEPEIVMTGDSISTGAELIGIGLGRVAEAAILDHLEPSAPVEIDEMTPDEINQMAFEEGEPAEDGDGYSFSQEEFDLFVQRLLDRAARERKP